ncbi:MAG: helix-turn-helix domain-containing protein [Saprospiraceae bacterium]|nr:helix-turn-helix domain-containing protein [Saprospiraceae bacterium]
MHVSIIVPGGAAVLSSIVGPFKVFSGINQYLIDTGQRTDPFYEIDFVGISRETMLYDGIFSIRPTRQIQEIDRTDLIVITTIFGEIPEELERNREFIPWIRKMHYDREAEVASLCLGAFLLAKTGLVNGKECSTHWAFVDQFEQMFPEVNLQPHRIITEDAGVYSSGGSYSFLNLVLHLVQKYNGKDVANWAAKMFEIEIDRTDQGPFFIFQGQKSHEDILVKEIQHYIEENYQESFSLDDLSHRFNLSKRNLIRRFKRATHNTPLQYLQRVKMEAAKRDLEKTNHSISEIMFDTGYNDPKSFRQTFKKIVGIPPSIYRTRYGRA